MNFFKFQKNYGTTKQRCFIKNQTIHIWSVQLCTSFWTANWEYFEDAVFWVKIPYFLGSIFLHTIISYLFHWGCLPLRLSSIEVVFHWSHCPLRLPSTSVNHMEEQLFSYFSHTPQILTNINCHSLYIGLTTNSQAIQDRTNCGNILLNFNHVWSFALFISFFILRKVKPLTK